MRSFDFLPITRFSQAPPAGAASKPFTRILQPFAQVLDTRRSQMVVLGVELFRATASAAGQDKLRPPYRPLPWPWWS